MALTTIDKCVWLAKFVSAKAVGARPIGSKRAFEHHPTPHVFGVRHRFKMVWINAASNAAFVVEFQSFRHGSAVELISENMSASRPNVPASFPIKLAVA